MANQKVLRQSDGFQMLARCEIANTPWRRLKGLLGRSSMGGEEGLWIYPCNSIHTCFMKFEIDVFYLDRRGRVLKVKRNVKPWRVHWPVFRAAAVLETAPGSDRGRIDVGDILCLS